MKVKFVDFWNGYDYKNTYYDNVFKRVFDKFNIKVVQDNPDIIIFSVFGNQHLRYQNKIKVFYSAENYLQRNLPTCIKSLDGVWKYSDYVISHFNYKNEKAFIMPNYIRRYGYENLNKALKNPDRYFLSQNGEISERNDKMVNFSDRKFALFLNSNCSCHFRNNFVKMLNKYKKVDSPGKCLNNMKINFKDKIKLSENYKFIISFENSSIANYHTEKIVQPFFSRSIPIYHGDPKINNVFNSKSFINYDEYKNFDEFIRDIKSLENNEERFNQIINEEKIINNEIFDENLFFNFFEKIIKNNK